MDELISLTRRCIRQHRHQKDGEQLFKKLKQKLVKEEKKSLLDYVARRLDSERTGGLYMPGKRALRQCLQYKMTGKAGATFYRFWTRKEAIVKAIGKGIDENLVKIPATDGLHSVPRVLIGNFEKMTAFSFSIDNDYVGALAMTEDINDFDKITFCPLPNAKELESLL